MTGWSIRRGGRPRRWPVVAAAFTAVAGYLILAAAPASAAGLSVPSPTSGAAGTIFSITATGFQTPGVPGCVDNLVFYWGSPTGLVLGDIVYPGSLDPAVFKGTAPSGYAPMTYAIYAICHLPTGGPLQGVTRFTLTPSATTTTTTTTLPPTTTTVPPTTTTTRGAVTTTTAKPHGGTTTTAKPGGSTTTSSTTTTTTKPGTPTTTTTTLPKATQALLLSSEAIPPAGSETATGHGCNSNGTVLLTVDTKSVGKTTAGADGSYSAPLQVSSLPVGRYQVVAHCGLFIMASDFDVVLATAANPDTATMLIIIFFVLIGLALFRRRIRLDAPKAPSGSGDEEPGGGDVPSV